MAQLIKHTVQYVLISNSPPLFLSIFNKNVILDESRDKMVNQCQFV